MEQDPKILEAVALLRQAGRLDLLVEGALAPERPARRASTGVAAAVAACSPPRSSGVKKQEPAPGTEKAENEVQGRARPQKPLTSWENPTEEIPRGRQAKHWSC
ncbi:hypothetical protein NDU88_005425 [Pleurodeles waltl]|uniref:Uncharacterized protein n=1 Tax=Pleurodeles waltl TaxID=8319 RepID=A0AAV7TX38_PLEWA|nr:hypothetical protein NDU88_005425 [Pleurodeles waltl]